jgi:hypothetical protein
VSLLCVRPAPLNEALESVEINGVQRMTMEPLCWDLNLAGFTFLLPLSPLQRSLVTSPLQRIVHAKTVFNIYDLSVGTRSYNSMVYSVSGCVSCPFHIILYFEEEQAHEDFRSV